MVELFVINDAFEIGTGIIPICVCLHSEMNFVRTGTAVINTSPCALVSTDLNWLPIAVQSDTGTPCGTPKTKMKRIKLQASKLEAKHQPLPHKTRPKSTSSRRVKVSIDSKLLSRPKTSVPRVWRSGSARTGASSNAKSSQGKVGSRLKVSVGGDATVSSD